MNEKIQIQLNDTRENLEILKNLWNSINEGDKVHIGTYPVDHVLIVPSSTALQWLREEKPRLETKLEQLEKEL